MEMPVDLPPPPPPEEREPQKQTEVFENFEIAYEEPQRKIWHDFASS